MGFDRRRWPELLEELSAVIAASLERMGHKKEKAQVDAKRLVRELGTHFGGRTFYLPTGENIGMAERDAEILRLNNGANTIELARKYGISERRVQQIVARENSLRISRRREIA